METSQKQFYRGLLRSARADALADAEGFHDVVHSLELIGQQLAGKVLSLGRYKHDLSCLADDTVSLSHKPMTLRPTANVRH